MMTSRDLAALKATASLTFAAWGPPRYRGYCNSTMRLKADFGPGPLLVIELVPNDWTSPTPSLTPPVTDASYLGGRRLTPRRLSAQDKEERGESLCPRTSTDDSTSDDKYFLTTPRQTRCHPAPAC